MRKVMVRCALVIGIAMSLAVPAEAKPREGGRWFERKLDPIVKVIRKFVVRSMGDGLGDPWPKL